MALIGTRYVLAVHSLSLSVKYYTQELGFTLTAEHPGWAFLKRDSFSLMLGECEDAIDPKNLGDHSYFAYIDVDDVDALHAEYASHNVTIHKTPKSEPWGMREFSIETIDGHRIMFGQAVEN